MIVFDHLFCSAFYKEVNVKVPTGRDVAQYARAIIIERDDRSLRIRTPEKKTDVLVGRISFNETELMDSTQLVATRSVIFFGILTTCPHRPSALPEGELPITLTKTVKLLRW